MDEADLSEIVDAPVTVFDSTPDTGAHLRRRASEGAPHGTFAVADELTAATGRGGSGWAAPPGGIWSSTLLYPEFGPEHVGRLTIAGALAVADVADVLGVDARLKWPNDVVVERGARQRGREPTPHKLAGVLTEAVVDAVPVAGKPVDEVVDGDELEYVVLGVGLNANVDPEDLGTDRPVTTLRAEPGVPVDRTAVAASLHERLLARADAVETDDGFAAVLDDWRARAATLGETVRVERRDGQVLTGEPVDVDDRGALVVETDEGKRRVTEGECERLRRR
jgi:BirA family biotin operon repressor/biotin-[acetyl-CoA-carboxylase] ligase